MHVKHGSKHEEKKMPKPKGNAGAEDRTSSKFKYNARYMKRRVSINDVSRLDWLHERKTTKTCSTRRKRIKHEFWARKLGFTRTFIQFIIIMNFFHRN